MPTYTFRHKKTGEEKSEFMSISEMEKFKKKNPDWECMCGAPVMGYSILVRKPDLNFRDLLKNMKKKNIRSTINDNW